MELLESLALQQAEKYAHELVTWLCGILEKDQSDNQVGFALIFTFSNSVNCKFTLLKLWTFRCDEELRSEFETSYTVANVFLFSLII